MFANPIDGLIAGVIVIVLIGLARNGLWAMAPLHRLAAASGIAGLLGPYAYYVALRRLAFFRSDSVLAHVALDGASAWRYVLVIAVLACLAPAAALFLPDPALLSSFVASFCLSLAVAVVLAKGFTLVRRRLTMTRQEKLARIFASRHASAYLPAAAIGGAAIIAAAGANLDWPAAAAIATVIALALGLWYSPVAYSRVEYERLIGMSPTASLWLQLKSLLLLSGVLTAGAMLGLEMRVVGVTVAVLTLLLCYKILEILVVRAFGGNRAQFFLALTLFALAGVGIVLPVLLAVIVPAAALWLVRKGSKRTWQLT